MGIPFEIITMLGSTLLGGLMSLWSQSIKAKQAQQAMLMERAKFQQKAVKDAREYDNKGFQLRYFFNLLLSAIIWLKSALRLFFTTILIFFLEHLTKVFTTSKTLN